MSTNVNEARLYLHFCRLLLLKPFSRDKRKIGFDIDFPSIAEDPVVAAAVGYTGNNFLAESVGITRWYNRTTNVIAGSVIFSSSCEGPPGEMLLRVRNGMVIKCTRSKILRTIRHWYIHIQVGEIFKV